MSFHWWPLEGDKGQCKTESFQKLKLLCWLTRLHLVYWNSGSVGREVILQSKSFRFVSSFLLPHFYVPLGKALNPNLLFAMCISGWMCAYLWVWMSEYGFSVKHWVVLSFIKLTGEFLGFSWLLQQDLEQNHVKSWCSCTVEAACNNVKKCFQHVFIEF